MPHVHGVSWLNFTKDEEALYLLPDKTFDLDSSELPKLINHWTKCTLDTGNEKLDQIVKEVNIHTHTNSCQKGGKKCRFDFPKLPSKETLIAKPLDPNLSDEIRTRKMKRAREIKVKINIDAMRPLRFQLGLKYSREVLYILSVRLGYWTFSGVGFFALLVGGTGLFHNTFSRKIV